MEPTFTYLLGATTWIHSSTPASAPNNQFSIRGFRGGVGFGGLCVLCLGGIKGCARIAGL